MKQESAIQLYSDLWVIKPRSRRREWNKRVQQQFLMKTYKFHYNNQRDNSKLKCLPKVPLTHFYGKSPLDLEKKANNNDEDKHGK